MSNHRQVIGLIASATMLLSGALASAQSNWTFGKIADTGTTYPTGSGLFTDFDEEPVSSNGNITFKADGGNPIRTGIIKSSLGAISVVADQFTNAPGGGMFGNFGTSSPSISLLNPVVFTATLPGGVFRGNNGLTPEVIADTDTMVPGSTENFTQFDFFSSSVSGLNAIFRGVDPGNSFQPGIYGEINGTLITIAKFGSNPGGPTLAGISGGMISGTNVAFYAVNQSNGRQGVYIHQGVITNLVDTADFIPNGVGTFTDFGESPFRGPSISGIHVAFLGRGSSQQVGIYHTIGGLVRAADTSTAIPEGNGNFQSFSPPSLGSDNLIFRGTGSGAQEGIYFIKAILGSLPDKVIARGDSLDGKTVDQVGIGRESLDEIGNQQFAFWVRFTDNSEGIFLATNLDCAITADDEVVAGSTGNVASAPVNPGVYNWTVTGGVLEDGDGTNMITYTAGDDPQTPELSLELTIIFNAVSVDCIRMVTITCGPTATASNDGPVCDGEDVNLMGGPDGTAWMCTLGRVRTDSFPTCRIPPYRPPLAARTT